jgi:predicted NBD/HSP70 family sugar kinase
MIVSGLAPFDRRGHYRRVIVETLRHVKIASRTEIASQTRLSPQVVTSLVDALIRDGLIQEVGRRASARGQPPVDLSLNAEGGFAIGVQVEAESLTGIICDLAATIRAETTMACRTDDPDAALRTLRALVDRLTTVARIDRDRLWGIGIVLPGPFGSVEDVERDPLAMPAWSRAPFRDRFSKVLSTPVFVGNDATAAAIGEHLNGVARNLRNFFYLYLGEGIGGGLFIEGQPVAGAFGNAGEIGRMHIAHSSDGSPPRLEAVASVDALRRSLIAAGLADAADMRCEALFQADERVVALWLKQAADSLRVAIANIENFVDPEAIVIGGQVAEPYLTQLLNRMQPLLPSVSQRADRALPRVLMGDTGRVTSALGGATLPLFSKLTIHPQATRAKFNAANDPQRSSGKASA